MALSRPSPQTSRIEGLPRLLVTLFLAPAPFEIAIGVAKRESYDFRRVIIIVGTLAVIALVLTLLRRRTWWYPQIIVGYYVTAVGLAVAGFGITATIWDDGVRAVTRWSRGVEIAVTALAPTLGILLVVAGVYLIIERRRRAFAELDAPMRERVEMARMTPLKQHTSAVWTSEDTTRLRGREKLISLCQEALNVADLHYVAYYTADGECNFYVDLFDDEDIALKARGDNSDRRINYVRHARHLRHVITKLNARISDLHTGPMVRVVLDVEQGAIFYYDLGKDGFLVGVTLDQRQVDPTDWKMSNLANAILRSFGKQEDDDFYRLCPVCGANNRGHDTHRGDNGGNVVPLPRPSAS